MQLIAVPVARVSATLSTRLGLTTHLLLSIALQVAIIFAMTSSHLLIALLLLGRSIPRALQETPLRTAVAPSVGAHLRATYLPLQSLFGRLGYAVFLGALAWSGSSSLPTLLTASGAVSLTLLALLSLMAWRWRAALASDTDAAAS